MANSFSFDNVICFFDSASSFSFVDADDVSNVLGSFAIDIGVGNQGGLTALGDFLYYVDFDTAEVNKIDMNDGSVEVIPLDMSGGGGVIGDGNIATDGTQFFYYPTVDGVEGRFQRYDLNFNRTHDFQAVDRTKRGAAWFDGRLELWSVNASQDLVEIDISNSTHGAELFDNGLGSADLSNKNGNILWLFANDNLIREYDFSGTLINEQTWMHKTFGMHYFDSITIGEQPKRRIKTENRPERTNNRRVVETNRNQTGNRRTIDDV